MFTANDIKTAFLSRIGWRQNEDISDIQLTDLTASSSGLYYNGVHPVLTIQNLISIAPNYKKIHDDATAQNNAFTNWLKQKTEEAIVQALTTWFTEKSELGTANSLLDDKRLFSVSGDITNTEEIASKVYGLEFVVSRSQTVKSIITEIGLQFDTNQTIDLYLFKSDKTDHVQTQSVSYTGEGSVQWQSVTWNCEGSGVYYIVYDGNEVSGNKINGVRDHNYLSKGLTAFPSGRFWKATAFEASGNVSSLWDITKNSYSVSSNHGLNMKVHVVCDYTEFIERQVQSFDSYVHLSVGAFFMKELAFNANSRINKNEAGISQAKLLYELNGDTQGDNSMSVSGRLKKALNSVQFDSTGIDKICLPCRRRSAQYKSIGPSSY